MNAAPWHGRPVIYRCYAETGALLYIGSSRNVTQRMDAHSRLSFWFAHVARVRIQIAANELDARRREAAAIREENPRFNLMHRRPRSMWNEQDYRDAIRSLRGRVATDHTRRRIAALRRELGFRQEGLA